MNELKENDDLDWWWLKGLHHHWIDINKIYKINDKNINENDATRASSTTNSSTTTSPTTKSSTTTTTQSIKSPVTTEIKAVWNDNNYNNNTGDKCEIYFENAHNGNNCAIYFENGEMNQEINGLIIFFIDL